jgi:hypothetical protein
MLCVENTRSRHAFPGVVEAVVVPQHHQQARRADDAIALVDDELPLGKMSQLLLEMVLAKSRDVRIDTILQVDDLAEVGFGQIAQAKA